MKRKMTEENSVYKTHLPEIKLLSAILENCPETMNKIGKKNSVINPEFLTPILFSNNIRPVEEWIIEADDDDETRKEYKNHFLTTMKKNDSSPKTSVMLAFNIHFRHNDYDSTALVTKVKDFLSSKKIKSVVIPPTESRTMPMFVIDLAQENLLANLQAIHKMLPEKRIRK